MLRGLLFSLLFVSLAPSLSAQDKNYTSFEWDLIQLGYANATGSRYGGGILFGSAVRYNIDNRFSTGLSWDLPIFARDLGNDLVDVGVSVNFSLTGDYYFVEDRTTRPFVGLGFGRYGSATTIANVNDDEIDEDDIVTAGSFGISPRVGIELSHFRVALELNLTFNDQAPNYFGLTFAPTLWGGLKKKSL